MAVGWTVIEIESDKCGDSRPRLSPGPQAQFWCAPKACRAALNRTAEDGCPHTISCGRHAGFIGPTAHTRSRQSAATDRRLGSFFALHVGDTPHAASAIAPYL